MKHPKPKKKARYCELNIKPQKCVTRTSNTTSTSKLEESGEISDLPVKYQHIRQSERCVRDEVYWTMAELDSHGFSYKECQLAIVTVGNILFGTHWKLPTEADETADINEKEREFDSDTLPTRKNIRKMLKNLEAYSLKLVGDKVIGAKTDGAIITHATDTTTRKYVGSFAPAGLHINRDYFLPLPTLPIATETTENVAESIAVDFRLLEAASGHSAEELYGAVNVHMTDSTAHNKGISEILADKFDRKDEAGQIFCDTHTALGFDRAMSKVINSVESKMGMENIFSTFLLEVDIDQKTDTVATSTVSWCLSLFGPENVQKPWNYYKDFCIFLKQQEKPVHLFQLKDARFGALSKSSAIMCHHWEDFSNFLETHGYITNKLACLVRDSLSLDYVKIVIAVVAVFGIQIISPYHAMTISTSATHSKLKVTFESLYGEMTKMNAKDNFFNLEEPAFSPVNASIFKSVKKDYGIDVILSITEIVNSNITDCISLANKILPQLANTLAMQRGKFYGFGDFPKEFTVFEQCEHIDLTPVHNLEMERQCGATDQRLKKSQILIQYHVVLY